MPTYLYTPPSQGPSVFVADREANRFDPAGAWIPLSQSFDDLVEQCHQASVVPGRMVIIDQVGIGEVMVDPDITLQDLHELYGPRP